jgi:SAM-dependent methyltransferase
MSTAGTTPARRSLARHLHGSGLELGPGHEPFPTPTGVAVRYVDRWTPDDNHTLFPELGAVTFPLPDVVADLDRDRLGAVADASVDFVIASHVLEHLADPLGMIDETHRVLRDGGVLLILLPDRRATFDAARPPTSLDHLVAEHAAGVTEVSDEHIIEFVAATEPDRGPLTPGEIDLHRRRSIHVHCWAEDEFVSVVSYGVGQLGHRWRFVDGLRTGAPGSVGIEFGAVLRKDAASDDDAAARLEEDWRWYDGAAARADDGRADALAARLAAIEASTSWRWTAPMRAVSARARGLRRRESGGAPG